MTMLCATSLAAGIATLCGCGASGSAGGTSTGTGGVVVTDAGADIALFDAAAGQDTAAEGDTGNATDSADAAAADAGTDTASPADAGAKDASKSKDAGSKGCPKQCADDEVCESGKCVKQKKPCGGPCPNGQFCDPGTDACASSQCVLPSKWGPAIQKMSYFAVAQSAQGCDLDGDATPDNVLGNILKLYPAVNQELDKSIHNGLFVMLLEAPDFASDGTTFAINGLLGEVDSSNASCSMTSAWASCKFTVDDDNYAGGPAGKPCPAQVVLSPATVATGGALKAGGGKGQTITVKLPTAIPLDVTLSQVSLTGYIEGGGNWDRTKKGKLCGVITQADFKKTIDAVPDEAWKELSLTKEQATLIIGATLKPDIDTNGDGFPDAISVAFLFETVKAKISKLVY